MCAEVKEYHVEPPTDVKTKLDVEEEKESLYPTSLYPDLHIYQHLLHRVVEIPSKTQNHHLPRKNGKFRKGLHKRYLRSSQLRILKTP